MLWTKILISTESHVCFEVAVLQFWVRLALNLLSTTEKTMRTSHLMRLKKKTMLRCATMMGR